MLQWGLGETFIYSVCLLCLVRPVFNHSVESILLLFSIQLNGRGPCVFRQILLLNSTESSIPQMGSTGCDPRIVQKHNSVGHGGGAISAEFQDSYIW